MTSTPRKGDTAPSSSHRSFSDDDGRDSAFNRLLKQAARTPTKAPIIAPGARLSGGRFEILRRVGEGGMGIVFEAFDATRREKVALKTMSRLEARDVYQFKNEFRALADVAHPNLVRLHELSADGELWFFTMELVQGERFDHWVRPGAPGDVQRKLDEARLRDTLPQLVQAVGAVHAAGKLHRDLKPSNVLVTAEGRLVALDFGLAIDPEEGGVGQTVADEDISGTPAYMAPEQAAGRGATAASDWYAVGVMLFEALTGRLPFEGSAQGILFAKQRDDAPRSHTLTRSAPSDLDELCGRLLALEPSARPDGGELGAMFAVTTASNPSGTSRRSWSSGSSGTGASVSLLAPPELLGREGELAALRDAFESAAAGQPVVLFVSGESGLGKSALCEAFLHELRQEGRATVLTGRCYERENVPFKGFDSLVDDLSRHLRRLPREEAIGVLPRDVQALTRLFPALGRVEVVAEAPVRDVPDPVELRRRAFAAFGELLTRMRDRALLCVHVDDVQWLDADAIVFMRALLVHPEPVPALLILSHRSEHAEENAALLRVRDAIEGNRRLELRELPVGPLSENAARQLAQRLLPEEALERGDATSAIACESGGSPFFVGELTRFVTRHGADAAGIASLSLYAALTDHLSTLPLPARRVLEQSALSGRPLPAALLLEAAEASHVELDLLQGSRLLRLSSLEGARIVECYHDKVREAVADGLSGLQRISRYAALAGALEAHTHGDAELLATCFEGAGQPTPAGEYYVRAAEQAIAGTAFLHAAKLYEKALSLGTFDAERLHTLTVARGDALSEAGRAKQAAEMFLRAAGNVEGAEHNDLCRRAAENLVAAGQAREGMALFRELFREAKLAMPSNSGGSALRHLLWAHLRLRLRGLDYVARDASDCSKEQLARLALYQSAHWGLSFAEPLTGASTDTDYLLHALRAGVATHVAPSMAFAAFATTVMDASAEDRITRMVDTAVRIASEQSDLRTFVQVGQKVALICFFRGLWKENRGYVQRTTEALRGNVPDAQWARDSLHASGSGAGFYLGEWLDLASTIPSLVEQAYSRDRIYSALMLSGIAGSATWLSGDDVVGYQRVMDQAKLRWQRTSEVQYPDMLLAQSAADLHLYRGEPTQAQAAIDASWPWLIRSSMARTQLAATILHSARGQAALAVLRVRGDSEARAVARSCSKRLARLFQRFAVPMRAKIEAGLALHEGNVELACKHLRAAVSGFDDNDMALHAAAARRRLGELIRGDEGKALLAAGDAVMRAQRIVDLDAVTEMLCAGCRPPSVSA